MCTCSCDSATSPPSRGLLMWSPPARRELAEAQITPTFIAPTASQSAALAAQMPAASQQLQLPTVPPPSAQLEGPATWDGTPQGTNQFEHPLAREQDQLANLNTSLQSAMDEYMVSALANDSGEQAR